LVKRALLPEALLVAGCAVWCMSAVPSNCQQNTGKDAPIVQPGAPGKSSTILTQATATAEAAPHEPSAADVTFMQGMIMHHSQAVEMTALLMTRSQDKKVHALGERINVSQTDEMNFMKRWLQERGKPLAEGHAMDMSGMNMAGMEHMDHMDMSAIAPMPGMLTPQQMDALRKATGPTFDHLFLTGMIQHHTGALTMVKQLFATQGAGQDPQLFDFANDVDNTQLAEIDIMQHLLQEER
jgi:uncharacterized protein (DUF305 family)